MDWQPIATAPTDGTHVLAWKDGHGPTEAYFEHGEDEGEYNGWVAYWSQLDFFPTHWMPLPPPPVEG